MRGVAGAIESVLQEGIRVSPIARTLSDIARWHPLEVSVPVLDEALRKKMIRHGDLLEAVAASPSRGAARGRSAIDFADAASGSPGESLSRVRFFRLGIRIPVLQHRVEDAGRLIGIVDFWWPIEQVIGEFDGEAKYLDERYTNGRSAAAVVLEEKRRENALRRRVDGFA
ncbi:MAG: hypothetical protein ACRCY9_01025, partial [Phycicoccus sp.]